MCSNRVVSFVAFAALASLGSAQQSSVRVSEPHEQPVLQARNVFGKDGYVGRALTIDIPRDLNGHRYFYSMLRPAAKRGSVAAMTTVESWTDASNRPLKAVYKVHSPGGASSTTFEFLPDKVRITKTGHKTYKRTEVPLKPGTIAVMSQFNPHDFPGKNLLVFDPNFTEGVEHFVDVVERAGRWRLYRVESAAGWSAIETDNRGRFQSMDNSSGLKMAVSEPTEMEIDFLLALAKEARGF